MMAGKRLKEIGFKFSTERDGNLIHFSKKIPNQSNEHGLLRVTYRLESPSLLDTTQKKEVKKQKVFL